MKKCIFRKVLLRLVFKEKNLGLLLQQITFIHAHSLFLSHHHFLFFFLSSTLAFLSPLLFLFSLLSYLFSLLSYLFSLFSYLFFLLRYLFSFSYTNFSVSPPFSPSLSSAPSFLSPQLPLLSLLRYLFCFSSSTTFSLSPPLPHLFLPRAIFFLSATLSCIFIDIELTHVRNRMQHCEIDVEKIYSNVCSWQWQLLGDTRSKCPSPRASLKVLIKGKIWTFGQH